jgi:hypothetical protein
MQSTCHGRGFPFGPLAGEARVAFHGQCRQVQRIIVAMFRRQRLLEQLPHKSVVTATGDATLEAPYQIGR